MTARRFLYSCTRSFNCHRHFQAIEALCSPVYMSYRPNYQGGRRVGGGGRGRGGGGRRGGGGGRGEQRWWDPQWRAERLRQLAGPVEKLDPNEWQTKLQQLKGGSQQELIINGNFGREGQHTLEEMAHRHDLYFHAYNKGKSLVFSKVPLPDYRADLDERHGSTQKEIVMSVETEIRVENLLARSKELGTTSDSLSSSTETIKEYLSDTVAPKLELTNENQPDSAKEKFSVELRDLQISKKATCSAKAMQSFREKLPAYKSKDNFLKSMSCNQVLVVSGETGCGKTTQLPQFILEEEIANLNGADCNIICTQPRRISAISVATRVAFERGENLGEIVGYQIRLEAKRSAQTRLLFCTTGVLLRRLVQDPDFEGVSHLIVDEIHERGMNEDFLIIILRDLLPRRPDLRLILMSATLNADLFSKYFGNSPIIHIPGFTFPVEEIFLEDILEKIHFQIRSEFDSFHGNSRRRLALSKTDPLTGMFEDVDIDSCYKNYGMSTRQSLEAWSGSLIDLGLVEATVEYICRYEGDGAILVFLTGWDEISKLLDKIKANTFLGNPSKFLVLPLHGSMPTINQREIFDRPPRNMRKIILATNIAESSITIDDVVYVIDCGKAKETSYDALNKLACLLPSWISKASAHQRRGRAGRVQSGVCYRLYPKLIYDAMSQYQLPEILRTPLQELCLHIKSLQLGSVVTFLAKALQPPDLLAVNNALELLRTIGALDEREQLTPLGRHLCTLPVDPNIGKMLLMGSIFQCLDPALTIAAALAYRDPFVLLINRKEEADDAKRSFAGDAHRKIILATNIAESSITIDDVVYVIDCGKAKETSYDALNKLACLLPSWISKASAHQRRGRAGRVQSGVCYRLYPKLIYDAMPQYQLPEILRTPLQELCLHIKSLQLGSVVTFLAKALQPPDLLAVNNALELLRTIGALDEREQLTPLGRHLCTLPVDPNIGKMLLMGSIFQCLDPALTIAAALAYRDPFVLPINRKEEADDAKRSFAGDAHSDHIALLNAFDAWKDAKRGKKDRAFCWENFLSPITLQMMDDMRSQFLDLLSDIGFVNKAKGIKVYNLYGGDIEMVRAILCAGLYPNVIQCKRRGKRTAFYSKDVGKVEIHPSSVNARIYSFPLPYMAYSEKVKTTSVFIRDSTNISDYALLLFGGSLTPSKTGEDIEMLGGYLHFSAPKSVRQLIQRLRGELDRLLQRKIEEPSLDMNVGGRGVVDAAIELLHS